MIALVEGFDPDQVALARHLAETAATVRLTGPGSAPRDALELAATHGVAVQPHLDLDRDPGPADVAYLDVWTPAVAPRVLELRARGCRITCLGELLLERARGLTIGVTGTAGKTTTAAVAVQLLRAAGVAVDASTTARLGNLWPTAELLHRADDATPLLLELTSSHLAFMSASPHVAAITCFWPDHLELHGSLAAYRAAKETIVRGQRPGDTVVVNADDAAARELAQLTPAALVETSLGHAVERGVCVRDGVVVVRDGADRAGTPVAALADVPFPAAQRADVLLAIAIAVAAGADPAALADRLASIRLPAHRATPLAAVDGVTVIDDGMAATPAKARAVLATFAAHSIVLIAGGSDDAGGGPVHATPEEQELLACACDEIARVARRVVLFGPAGKRLERLLAVRGVACIPTRDLEAATSVALASLEGARALVFSPLFPVAAAERLRFRDLVRAVGISVPVVYPSPLEPGSGGGEAESS